MTPLPDPRRAERRLFLLLLGLHLATAAFLAVDRRLMRGHDSFISYSVQYFSSCHAAQGGGSHSWAPLLAHGSQLAGSSLAAFPTLAPALGRCLEGVPFLPLYYALVFLFHELLLLVGTWLLGRRLFSDPRVTFFVSAAVTAGTLWIDYPGPLSLLMPFPLALAFILDFLETGSRPKAALSALLLAYSLLGGYSSLLVAGTLTFLLGAGFLLYRRRAWPRVRAFRFRTSDLLWAAAVSPMLLLIVSTATRPEDLVLLTAGRTAEGTVGLDTYLTYAGYLNPFRFLELVLGLSPSLDFVLFSGTFTLAFALLAFAARPTRATLLVALGFLVTLLFSTGYLSVAAYQARALIPPMAYFRAVAMATTLSRFFLVLLAGYGFQALLEGRLRGRRAALAVAAGLALAALATGILSLQGPGIVEPLGRILESARRGYTWRHELAETGTGVGFLASAAAFLALAAGALGAAFLGRWRIGAVAAAVLVFHAAQLFAWKGRMLDLKTIPLSAAAFEHHRLRPIPFSPRRIPESPAGPRYEALRASAPKGRPFWPYGTEHSQSELFFLTDAAAPGTRLTVWHGPLDDLLRAYAGQTPGDRSVPPAFARDNRISLPSDHPGLLKAVGLSADKLRVFRRAHPLPSREAIAAAMRHPAYRGDLLFVEGEGTPPPDLSADEVLPEVPAVESFDADHLTVRVRAPEGAWLSYADVWHARWTATVNGGPVAVRRANLAYKAVPLREGENVVTFRFVPAPRAALALKVGALFMLLLGAMNVTLAARIALGRY
jgi:hypothetical protein